MPGPSNRGLVLDTHAWLWVGGRLATRDRTILGYAGGGHVAVVDVAP